jgi:DNA polymerase
LQRILKDIGKVRTDANYTNVALCRSTRNIDGRVLNRTPTPEEYGCCYNRLVAEVKKADPIVIVSLGGTAYCALTGTKPEELKMNKIVGVPFKWLEYDVIPTYHPTFVLYNGGEKTIKGNAIRTQIKMDIQHALTILKTPKQLRLF